MKRGKTGGRKPGSPNKVTTEMREWIKKIIDDNRGQFEADLKAVDPEKRLMIIEKLIGYIIPKPQSTNITVEYRQLERLLERTPEEYIERITAKLLTLNSQNNEPESEETD